jgi:hypothetical protein
VADGSPDITRHSPRWTIGDRYGAFGVLLPAHPVGPVVLAVGGRVASVLQSCFPGSTLLESQSRPLDRSLPPCGPVVRWDGSNSPLQCGSVGLLVVDTSITPVEALQQAVASDGTLATLGRSGQYVLYPSAEHPEQIWRPDWPVGVVPGLVRQLRRALGLWLNRQRRVARLHIRNTSQPSAADVVIADLAARTGVRGHLAGVHTGGFTILRVRGAGGDVAVRLSLSNAERTVDVVGPIVAEVPEIASLVPAPLASGRAAGRPWVATPWYPQHRRLLRDLWRPDSRRWAAAERLVRAMRSVQTGVTATGWARAWCEAVDLLPTELSDRLVDALEILEAPPVPTGWSHGDLWPGNILLGGGVAKVIDWDNATSEGPQGLDSLLIAAVKAARRSSTSMASECIRLVDSAETSGAVVGGRRWDEWARDHRVALALTAVLLYLRNRSHFDISPQQLATELAPVRALLDAPCPEPPQ